MPVDCRNFLAAALSNEFANILLRILWENEQISPFVHGSVINNQNDFVSFSVKPGEPALLLALTSNVMWRLESTFLSTWVSSRNSLGQCSPGILVSLRLSCTLLRPEWTTLSGRSSPTSRSGTFVFLGLNLV